jgi:hypothetical protein
MAVECGCKQKQSNGAAMSKAQWLVLCKASRATIINGSQVAAVKAWLNLKKDDYTQTEKAEWIQLQIDILEQTENDIQKQDLRLSAIQELYWEYRDLLPHYAWLTNALKNGLFVDAAVQKQAKELADELSDLKGTKQ